MKQPNLHSMKLYVGSRSRIPCILSFGCVYRSKWLASSMKEFMLVPTKKAVCASRPVGCNVKEMFSFHWELKSLSLHSIPLLSEHFSCLLLFLHHRFKRVFDFGSTINHNICQNTKAVVWFVLFVDILGWLLN
jgi:hypothetical protein